MQMTTATVWPNFTEPSITVGQYEIKSPIN